MNKQRPLPTRLAAPIAGQVGFTLVELMITLALTGVLVAAIYTTYTIQQKTYYTQGQVIEMQQNIRSAMEIMGSFIRMAGYDPGETLFQGSGAQQPITVATSTEFGFAADIDANENLGDGTVDEYFLLYHFVDGNVPKIGLEAAKVVQNAPPAVADRKAVAEYIEELEFAYTLADGSITLDATGQESEIRGVTITVLAKNPMPDPKFVNTEAYVTPGGQDWQPAANDNYRRRLLSQNITLRNMGMF